MPPADGKFRPAMHEDDHRPVCAAAGQIESGMPGALGDMFSDWKRHGNVPPSATPNAGDHRQCSEVCVVCQCNICGNEPLLRDYQAGGKVGTGSVSCYSAFVLH